MGSRIKPYFILTAEKVTDPKEIKDFIEQNDCDIKENIPTTPPPSGVSGKSGLDIELNTRHRISKKEKGFVKYKIPMKEVRKKGNLNKKMELIKEKLEKSRERFKEQKRSNEELNLTCEPTRSQKDVDTPATAFKFERSVSDVTPVKSTEENSPYTYFVVSDDNSADITPGKVVSKSADKRRRLRIVEENRLKRDRKEGQKPFVKRNGLARELGLKSSIIPKSDSRSANKPSVSQIVFEGPEHQTSSQHTTNSKILRTSFSPPRIPPGTPATVLTAQSGENKTEQPAIDVDESVPRKPFLSGPLYTGKNRGTHAFSLQHFELPIITPEQKRRALGLGTKFEEFAYPKPQSEQRQRRVSFANPLPVVKGTGLIVSYNEMKEYIGFKIAPLGPRAVTMGSITLPSERLDKKSMCQKYMTEDNMSSSKRLKKVGVPLSLPKIDIVSNVYDDMIIKMIKEYLQDTNTPSRQSQLAKELLVHLQKHNEHMKELNVPHLNRKQKPKLSQEELAKCQSRAQQLLNDINLFVPPNTAEDMEPKVMTPTMKAGDLVESGPPEQLVFDETGDKRHVRSADNPRSIPFVQITFKPKDKEPEPEMNINLPEDDATLPEDRSNSKKHSNERKSNDRPILSAVTPVSFQMAPPGLSKDDSFVKVPLKA
ncbi:uncharacterized protein LOC123545543 [Mercenaria mercenaria]|uniref:uncharacterized protein LOC123545543 n=1 Tax=Mercenaria mercenaria TaxID=6596 RepID=UPI00234F842E|nr:uncharacterized protein LOC123545543 [Mercenaria mercenaria]XP_045187809.2 uncharacterized protein LOC123545543 [Mercenaria mercenaria]